MTDEELLQIIEQASRNGVVTLNLSGHQLTRLPPDIGRLTNLKTLYLHDNQLTGPRRRSAG